MLRRNIKIAVIALASFLVLSAFKGNKVYNYLETKQTDKSKVSYLTKAYKDFDEKNIKNVLINVFNYTEQDAQAYAAAIVKDGSAEYKDLMKKGFKTIAEGTKYQKHIKAVMYKDGYVFAHNDMVADVLAQNIDRRGILSKKGFEKIYNKLNAKDTFKVSVTKDGLVKTSGVDAEANVFMGSMIWYSDTLWVTNNLLKYVKPEVSSKAYYTLAKIYLTQKDMFEKIAKDPAVYHNGGKLDGIAHLFQGDSLEIDANFNRRRLESHGMALWRFSQAIADGVYYKQSYGFPSADIKEAKFDDVLQSIAYLAKYFDAIKFYDGKTKQNGNWEEVPFEKSMWDATAITRGYEALCDLLFNEKYNNNKDIQQVRAALNAHLKEVFGTEVSKEYIDNLIAKGWAAVRSYYPAENALRERDASSVFTAAYAKLDDNPKEDIKKRLNLLDLTAAKLLKQFAMQRYPGDSYLSTNFNFMSAISNYGKVMLPNASDIRFGSADTSEEGYYELRNSLLLEGYEAQWLLPVPMGAIACSRMLEEATAYYKQNPNDEEMKGLIKRIWETENKYIIYTLAGITPAQDYITANGFEGQKWTFPEAFEAVTIATKGQNSFGFIVGAHTPLAWTVANAKESFVRFEKDLKTIESLGL
jgi:hypothetical protein